MKLKYIVIALLILLVSSVFAQRQLSSTFADIQAITDSLTRMDSNGNPKGSPINSWVTPLSIQETINVFLTVYKEFKDNTQKFYNFVLLWIVIGCMYVIWQQAGELKISQQERLEDWQLMSWKIDSLSSVKIEKIKVQQTQKKNKKK